MKCLEAHALGKLIGIGQRLTGRRGAAREDEPYRGPSIPSEEQPTKLMTILTSPDQNTVILLSPTASMDRAPKNLASLQVRLTYSSFLITTSSRRYSSFPAPHGPDILS